MKQMSRTQRHRWLFASAITVTCAAAVTGLSGCSFVSKQFADAWAVTYEISATGEGRTELHDVEYADAPSRGEDSETVRVGSVSTRNIVGEPTRARWTTTVQVTATQPARIVARPAGSAALTCRILLDDTTEIASAASAPGEAVSCSAVTPTFSSKD